MPKKIFIETCTFSIKLTLTYNKNSYISGIDLVINLLLPLFVPLVMGKSKFQYIPKKNKSKHAGRKKVAGKNAVKKSTNTFYKEHGALMSRLAYE